MARMIGTTTVASMHSAAGTRYEYPIRSLRTRQLISGRVRGVARDTVVMRIPDPGCVLRHSGARSEPGISRFRVWSFGPSRNDEGLRHFLLQNLGEAVEAIFPGDLSKVRLLDQRHDVGVDLAAPPGQDALRHDQSY